MTLKDDLCALCIAAAFTAGSQEKAAVQEITLMDYWNKNLVQNTGALAADTV